MESEISMQVPTFSIPALKGAEGAKVKDMCATSGAQICISSPRQGDPLTEVLISGTQHSIRIALLLIKMAVLHGRAGDKLTLPAEYLPNKKAEAELNQHLCLLQGDSVQSFPHIVLEHGNARQYLSVYSAL